MSESYPLLSDREDNGFFVLGPFDLALEKPVEILFRWCPVTGGPPACEYVEQPASVLWEFVAVHGPAQDVRRVYNRAKPESKCAGLRNCLSFALGAHQGRGCCHHSCLGRWRDFRQVAVDSGDLFYRRVPRLRHNAQFQYHVFRLNQCWRKGQFIRESSNSPLCQWN